MATPIIRTIRQEEAGRATLCAKEIWHNVLMNSFRMHLTGEGENNAVQLGKNPVEVKGNAQINLAMIVMIVVLD